MPTIEEMIVQKRRDKAMEDYNRRKDFGGYFDELDAKDAIEKTGRSADPAQQIRSSRQARKFFDVDSVKEIQRGDIRNAQSLLGVDDLRSGYIMDGRRPDDSVPPHAEEGQHGTNAINQIMKAGDVDRGLFFMGDLPYKNPVSKRESAPLNSSLLDPLYSASNAVRDAANEYVPGIGKAIDGADNWLFNATGGLLGTPSNITPENQLNLRKAFRDQKEKDDAYRFERR